MSISSQDFPPQHALDFEMKAEYDEYQIDIDEYYMHTLSNNKWFSATYVDYIAIAD